MVFQWGSFSTARFTAYVSSVDATYTLFGTTGMPIRATCQVQLHEIPSKTKGQNPTSGALTAQRVHRVVAGDSLQSLAWREYGDATAWRTIAEANDIDDPTALPHRRRTGAARHRGGARLMVRVGVLQRHPRAGSAAPSCRPGRTPARWSAGWVDLGAGVPGRVPAHLP